MIFLVDNGSVRVAAYQNLCSVAGKISETVGEKVVPAPLLQANKIPASELNGNKVALLESAIETAYQKEERQFEILPFFFGPSGALVDYLPRRLRILKERYPDLSVKILNPLFVSESNGGNFLVNILKDRINEMITAHSLDRFEVVLVDHGSPNKHVTNVRDVLARMLNTELEPCGAKVTPASMERRPGDEYVFNEPLLENLLKKKKTASDPIILSQLFLSPGRHAGPDGDIDSICQNAEAFTPQLKVYRTDLVGHHPLLIDLLARRWEERKEISSLEL